MILYVPERPGVEHAVGGRRQRPAHVVELPVAVYRADHGQVGAPRQQRPGQVAARAVRVYKLEALGAYQLLHLAERGKKAPGEDARLYPQRRRLLGEGAVPEADQRHVHIVCQRAQQRVDMGLGSARISAAYQMYNFHIDLRAACLTRLNDVK